MGEFQGLGNKSIIAAFIFALLSTLTGCVERKSSIEESVTRSYATELKPESPVT